MNSMLWTDLSKIIDVKFKKRILQVLLREVFHNDSYVLLFVILLSRLKLKFPVDEI